MDKTASFLGNARPRRSTWLLGIMNKRATFDPQVVAEWQRRRTAFRQTSRWVWVAYWSAVLLAPSPFLFGVIPPWPAALVTAFVALLVGLFLRCHTVVLTCPHCGKRPAPDSFGQIPIGDVDCCPHCSYWLIDLRGSVEHA